MKEKKPLTIKQKKNKARAIQYTLFGGEFVSIATPYAIMAGVNAGMKTCAIDDDFSRSQNDKKRELADYYINDFNDIMNGTYEVL